MKGVNQVLIVLNILKDKVKKEHAKNLLKKGAQKIASGTGHNGDHGNGYSDDPGEDSFVNVEHTFPLSGQREITVNLFDGRQEWQFFFVLSQLVTQNRASSEDDVLFVGPVRIFKLNGQAVRRACPLVFALL